MSTCAHCGIVRVHLHITLFFQCKFAQTAELPEMKSLTVIHEQLNESFPVIMKCSCFPKLQ
jgi:hypothetical protein